MADFKKIGAMWSRKDKGKMPSGKINREALMGVLAEMDGDLQVFLKVNKYKQEGDKKPDFELVAVVDTAKAEPEAGGYTKDPDEDLPF